MSLMEIRWLPAVALALVLQGTVSLALAAGPSALPGLEPRQRLDVSDEGHSRDVALTLDACGGAYDAALIATLARLQVPATVFVTRRWLEQNPQGLQELLAHPELFELENHGAAHVPALVGQQLYRMRGPADVAGVEREVTGGSQAVQRATGKFPAFYRGAGARYDSASLQLIDHLGLRVAGYSLNADDGATASAATVARRLQTAQAGDIVIAHMNHPASGTAAGLALALPLLQQRGLRFVKLSQTRGVLPLVVMPPPARRKTTRRGTVL